MACLIVILRFSPRTVIQILSSSAFWISVAGLSFFDFLGLRPKSLPFLKRVFRGGLLYPTGSPQSGGEGIFPSSPLDCSEHRRIMTHCRNL